MIVLPLTLIALVFVHIVALHEVGSNNPDGIEIKEHKGPDGVPLDGVPFHPHHTSKDLIGIIVFLMIFFGVVFFAPEMGGYFLEHANFEPADPLKTPEHIAPVWYFTPYYAMLRATPPLFESALPGVLVMFAAIIVLFFLPWIDRNNVKSIRYRSAAYKVILTLFVISFLWLGWLGLKPPTGLRTALAQIWTIVYFGFFVALYIISKNEQTKPVPERVTD